MKSPTTTSTKRPKVKTSLIGPIIKEIRIAQGKTLVELASLIDDDQLSPSTIQRIEASKDNRATMRVLTNIAAGLGMRLSELIACAENGAAEPPDNGLCPILSSVEAGAFAESCTLPNDSTHWVPIPSNGHRNCFALQVRGESMISMNEQKSFYPGDIIIIDPLKKTPAEGDLIVAHIEGSEHYTFKKYSNEDGRPVLLPLNLRYPIIYPKEETRIIGTVIGRCDQAFRIDID